jgi:hypothetical protein
MALSGAERHEPVAKLLGDRSAHLRHRRRGPRFMTFETDS